MRQKVRILLLLLGLCWFSGQGVLLYAQEDDEQDYYEDEEDSGQKEGLPLESDWDGYMTELYSRGDQTFTVSLGVIFPALFINNGKVIDSHFNPPVGGTGALAYTYFLGSHFFLGAEIGVKFNYTLHQNTVFLIPIGVRTGWQFLVRRFEFPLTFTIGIAPQRYLEANYLGLFLKGRAAAYFRFNPDWSFGMGADWNWYPQRPKEDGKPTPHKNVDANIIGLTLSARYHF